jgi:hypothetical protein
MAGWPGTVADGAKHKNRLGEALGFLHRAKIAVAQWKLNRLSMSFTAVCANPAGLPKMVQMLHSRPHVTQTTLP